MRNLIVGGALLAAVATAFSPAAVTSSHSALSLAEHNLRGTVCFSSVTNSADCGCGGATTISGSPSEKARLINPREALAKSTVYRLDGSPASVSNLLTDGVNLVVVTRSFGIGKPEIGLELCDHLGIDNGQEYIYADPENDCYSNLALNSGWNTMIRPATAFRFKDRFSQRGSMNSLFEVLGKWKDAVYIPPKLEQSTNHGGTFIFRDDEVLFAHYDESPGTHYDPNEAVNLAIEAAS
eukprot:scaffold39998_cov167-Skeletonema_dohrnii-CCMP3373.AAC.4